MIDFEFIDICAKTKSVPVKAAFFYIYSVGIPFLGGTDFHAAQIFRRHEFLGGTEF